ncbi:MAG: hypothetical protein C3F11_22420 [Methylocystaceae bacterium]|nr:MAG: hypothetical protein C3F11_22420 [Methylocystaceae bacterium]
MSCGNRSGHATAGGDNFPPPDKSGFASRHKIAAARRPPLRYGRQRCRPALSCRLGRPRRPRWARPIRQRATP